MDKIGDYFYLIIIGVVVLTRIISAVNKTKRKDFMPESEPIQPSSNWEEVLRELRGETNTPKPAPMETIPSQRQKKEIKTLTTETFQTKERQQMTIMTTDFLFEKEEDTEEKKDWGSLLTDAEDIKKAFVLSEILQKKY